MGTLEIKLFGTLSLVRDRQPLARFPSKRVKDLLSYLLLNRDVLHPREQLAGLFWPEMDTRKARHCLNTALWRLNQVLLRPGEREHPYLRVDADTIGFNTASDFRLDVAEFEAHCALAGELGPQSSQRRAALYHQAVTLYQADLLTDCYDDWCIVERERLVRLHMRALGQLVEHYAQQNEHDAAIDYALRILAYDPLREEVHRDLINLYLSTQRTADALRQYRTCEDIIHRELGIAPMPETQALLPLILSSSARETEAPLAPTSLPVPREQGADAGDWVEAALISLRQAVTSFELAYVQLIEATVRVEAAAQALGAVPQRHPEDFPTIDTVMMRHARQGLGSMREAVSLLEASSA